MFQQEFAALFCEFLETHVWLRPSAQFSGPQHGLLEFRKRRELARIRLDLEGNQLLILSHDRLQSIPIECIGRKGSNVL